MTCSDKKCNNDTGASVTMSCPQIRYNSIACYISTGTTKAFDIKRQGSATWSAPYPLNDPCRTCKQNLGRLGKALSISTLHHCALYRYAFFSSRGNYIIDWVKLRITFLHIFCHQYVHSIREHFTIPHLHTKCVDQKLFSGTKQLM